MSDEWYYRIDDEVHGPVEFAELVKAYAVGTLEADQSIRRTPGGWLPASSFRPLLEAKEAYLDQQRAEWNARKLEAVGAGGNPTAATSPSDLRDDDSSELSPISNAPASKTPDVSPRAPASMEDTVNMQVSDEDTIINAPVDQDLAAHPWYQFLMTRMAACQLCLPGWDPSLHTWFILCNGKQTGPFSLMQLVGLARDGELRATDWIGCAEAGRWGPLDPSSEPLPIPPTFAPQPQVWMPPYGGYLDPMMMMAPNPAYFSPPEPEVEEPQPTGRERMPVKLPEPDFSPMVAVKKEVEDRKDAATNSKNDAAIIAAQLLRKVQVKKKKSDGSPKKSGGWSLAARKSPEEEAALAKQSSNDAAAANPMDMSAIGSAKGAPQRAASGGSRSLASNQLAVIGIAAVVIGGAAAWFLLS